MIARQFTDFYLVEVLVGLFELTLFDEQSTEHKMHLRRVGSVWIGKQISVEKLLSIVLPEFERV
ncbi:MAG: hypothetical protein IJS05_03420 [Paludibacteraceae bacterium]|nr:hypothetical protein [Paludibacteraceae bacterium]